MKRLYFLDSLRIIAICAVILLHVAGSYWYKLDVASYSWQVMNVYDCITRWGVPVFVMISGALFLDPDRPQSIRKMWTKNIPRIVALILFWGALYALLYDLPAEFTQESVLQLVKDAIFGPGHLWFLFMLLGLYILVPVLRCITQNEIAMRYFLAVGLVVNFLFPLLNASDAMPVVSDLFDMLLIQLPVGYSFYFVLGYYLMAHPPKRPWRIAIYAIGLAGLVVSILATSFSSLAQGSADNTFISGSYFFMFAAAGVFIFARQLFEKRTPSEEALYYVKAFSDCTLGVYVVHIFVLRTLMSFGLNATDFDPVFAVPLLAIICAGLSFGIAWFLKKIPFFGRYLV